MVTGAMSNGSKHRQEYVNRVNRVIDHIQAHRAEALELEKLAQIAAFSPFHFHRIFRSITGENLGEFVQRIRLEWAGTALLQRPQADVLEIALDSGFQSASAFARAFKEHFGVTATAWRSGGAAAWRKQRMADRNFGQADRKPGKETDRAMAQPRSCGGQDPPEENTMNVNVETLPGYRLAYLRNIGPYGGAGEVPQLWLRLLRWAAPRDLWTPDRLCVGIAHDNPNVTDPTRCRYDAGIVIPADFKVDSQVNVVDFPGGKFALGTFEGTAQTIAGCWEQIFSGWLPRSGYQPDDRPCIELYRGDAWDLKTGIVRCSLGIPIRPL